MKIRKYKLLSIMVVLSAVFIFQTNAYAEESLSTSNPIVDCAVARATFSASNLDPVGGGVTRTDGYALVLTHQEAGTKTILDANFAINEGNLDFYSQSKVYEFEVQYGADKCNNPGLPIQAGTYDLQLFRTTDVGGGVYDVDLNDPAGNKVTMTFNVTADERLCTVEPIPPYVAGQPSKVKVFGNADFTWKVFVHQGGPLPANPYATFTMPPSKEKIVDLVGSAIKDGPNIITAVWNNPDTANFPNDKGQCHINIATSDDANLDINKSVARCEDQVQFAATGLVPLQRYKVRLTCVPGLGDPPTYCRNNDVVEFDIPQGTGQTLTKKFNINGACASGDIAAKEGKYSVQLIDTTTNTQPPSDTSDTLELYGSPGSCNLSGVNNVMVVTGQPIDPFTFDITATPGVEFVVYINNRLTIPTVTIPASGTANVSIPVTDPPFSLVFGPTITSNRNDLSVKKKGYATTDRCDAMFQTITENWNCNYLSGNDSYNCDVCGELGGVKHICREVRQGPNIVKKCVPDTANICETVDDPEEPICSLDPAQVCPSCPDGEECYLNTFTNQPDCRSDQDNSCGELYEYDVIPPLSGNFGSFEQFLDALRGILIPLGIVLGLVFFLICGYKFMTSQGQPDKMRDAKECLTSAIIGLLVVTMSVSIMNTLINLAFKLF